MIEPISVTLDRKEYIRFNNYCYKNNYFCDNKFWSTPLIGMVAVFVVVFVIAFNLLNITLSQIIVAFIIALFLFLLIAARILQTFSRAIPDEGSYLLCEKKYHFDESGLHETSQYGSSLIKWESFKFIKTDGDLLYLFLDRVYAIIIPARCFASIEESQCFVEMLKEKSINRVE